MLNQAQGDRAILAKQLNISPQQMKYVTPVSYTHLFRKEVDAGAKALYPQADCFPQRKGGGSERTAGESQEQRQGDCKMNAINWKKLLLPNIPYLLFVDVYKRQDHP